MKLTIVRCRVVYKAIIRMSLSLVRQRLIQVEIRRVTGIVYGPVLLKYL